MSHPPPEFAPFKKCLSVADILFLIGAELPKSADQLALARCSRWLYDGMMPPRLRDVCLSLRDLSSFAKFLRTNTEHSARCRVLRVTKQASLQDRYMSNPKMVSCLDDLAQVLEILSKQSNLYHFLWVLEAALNFPETEFVRSMTSIWNCLVLSSLSLREIHILLWREEGRRLDSWTTDSVLESLTRQTFPCLDTLELTVLGPQPASPRALQEFLAVISNVSELELTLHVTGTANLTTDITFPHLQKVNLNFVSGAVTASGFLTRHPSLSELTLLNGFNGQDIGHSSSVWALTICNSSEFESHPLLLSETFQTLRYVHIYGPSLLNDALAIPTLSCILLSGTHMSRSLLDALSASPSLVEIGIDIFLGQENALLEGLRNSDNLLAIHLFVPYEYCTLPDGCSLQAHAIPPRLRYVLWEDEGVGPNVLFRIERTQDGAVMVNTGLPCLPCRPESGTAPWPNDSVFDHLAGDFDRQCSFV